MEAEDVVNLLDSFWFYPKILGKHSKLSPLEPAAGQNDQENPAKQKVPTKLNIRSRSRSHDHIMIKRNTSFSPNPVLPKSHLETILSQKELSREVPTAHIAPQMIKKTRKGSSKSLSELEFEELKGFMDLGFVFSEEDKNSSLADIIPGLHRFGQKINESEKVQEEAKMSRPYLSEAWEVLEKENRLSNWRVPVVNNEIVMKDNLKWWAHAVASAVR